MHQNYLYLKKGESCPSPHSLGCLFYVQVSVRGRNRQVVPPALPRVAETVFLALSPTHQPPRPPAPPAWPWNTGKDGSTRDGLAQITKQEVDAVELVFEGLQLKTEKPSGWQPIVAGYFSSTISQGRKSDRPSSVSRNGFISRRDRVQTGEMCSSQFWKRWRTKGDFRQILIVTGINILASQTHPSNTHLTQQGGRTVYRTHTGNASKGWGKIAWDPAAAVAMAQICSPNLQPPQNTEPLLIIFALWLKMTEVSWPKSYVATPWMLSDIVLETGVVALVEKNLQKPARFGVDLSPIPLQQTS